MLSSVSYVHLIWFYKEKSELWLILTFFLLRFFFSTIPLMEILKILKEEILSPCTIPQMEGEMFLTYTCLQCY